jgi:hypothetical protein
VDTNARPYRAQILAFGEQALMGDAPITVSNYRKLDATLQPDGTLAKTPTN